MSHKLPNHSKAMHKNYDVLQITKNESSSALAAPIYSGGVLRSYTTKRREMLPPMLHIKAPNTIPILKKLLDTYTDEQFKAVIEKLLEQWQKKNEKGIIVTKPQFNNRGLGRI
jgi:hypothetical protein